MAPRSLLAALFISATAAQSSLLTLPFFGYDNQSFVASVVAVSSSLTTLQLACPQSDYDNDDCGLFPYQTLTVGPSSYNMYYSDEGFTMTQDCITASDVCMESAGGDEANFPGSSTTTYDATDVLTAVVTVTAGVELLSAGASVTGPASTTATATATGTTTSGSLIVISGTAESTKTSGTASASSSSETKTGSASAAATTNAAVGKGMAGPALMAAGAGVGLLGLVL